MQAKSRVKWRVRSPTRGIKANAAYWTMSTSVFNLDSEFLRAREAAPMPVRDLPTESPRFALGFRLFLLVNATLFIRPGDVLTALQGLPLYNIAICLCLLASWKVIVKQLRWQYLKREPAVLCVLGLLVAIPLSHLVHGKTYEARMGVIDFVKIVLYFLLLVGLVNSVERLRTFLVTITVFVFCAAAISVLNYHEIIDVESMRVIHQDMATGDSGELVTIERLQSLGIFEDPNDFSLVLVAGMLVISELILRKKSWLRSLSLLLPLAFLGYAFALTRSRGGFLAFSAGFAVMAVGRWGWRRSIPVLVIAIPLVSLLFGGRQTNISLDEEDTGMGRIELWRDSLVQFHRAPLFGIGYYTLEDEIGKVSHNSYVHAFAELGLFGAFCFAGAFYFTLYGLKRMKGAPPDSLNPGALEWRSCVMAIIAAYATGIITLSRNYVLPTYTVIGFGVALLHVSWRGGEHCYPAKPVRNLFLVTLVLLFALELFVRTVAV